MAESEPDADGVNVNLIVQEELVAIEPPFAHVPPPEFAKLLAFAPVIVKNGVPRTCGAVPTLETVTVVTPLVVPTP